MKMKQAFQGFLALVTFCGIAYGIWRVLVFFVVKMTQINPAIAAAIIGAMATVSAGIAAVLITQKQTKRRELEEAHREKKVEIYNKYLIIVTRIIKGLNEELTAEKISEPELVNSLIDYKREILLWGSPKVIKAQLQYEAAACTGGNTFLAVDNLYRAIRDDIGLSNNGLAQFDLFKLFLKDAHLMDEFLLAGVMQNAAPNSVPKKGAGEGCG